MITIPAFAAIKNKLNLDDWLMLIELRYDDGDETTPELDRLYFRVYRPYNGPPPSADPDIRSIMFEGSEWFPCAIGDVTNEQKTDGEIPAFDIVLSNVNKSVESIIRNTLVEGKFGRLLYVRPELLADPTAKLEERFTIVSAHTNRKTATITVSSLGLDLWGVMLPWEVVSYRNFPGILGNRTYALK